MSYRAPISIFSQMFPPAPAFTEREAGNLTGKVFLITGPTSGIGYELAALLYSLNGVVYLASRSEEKLSSALERLKFDHPNSKGSLIALNLDTSDLASVKQGATEFLKKEKRLDVLFNNAGVMMPPPSSLSAQDHDLEMATNCLGHYLLTSILSPLLIQTARNSEPGAVRVVWVSSMLETVAFQEGIQLTEDGRPSILRDRNANYIQSKVGVAILGSEMARQPGELPGVLNIIINPGVTRTEIIRHKAPVPSWLMYLLFKGPKHAAYTELFAGLDQSLNMSEHNGSYVVPFGRVAEMPENIRSTWKDQESEGRSRAEKFLGWCKNEVKSYL